MKYFVFLTVLIFVFYLLSADGDWNYGIWKIIQRVI